jgi:hypothetical protein
MAKSTQLCEKDQEVRLKWQLYYQSYEPDSMNKQNSCFTTHMFRIYLDARQLKTKTTPKKTCLPRKNVFIQIYDDPPKIKVC